MGFVNQKNGTGDLQILGLHETIKAFVKLGSEYIDYLKQGADEATEFVFEKAKQKIPIGDAKNGHLRERLRRSKAVIRKDRQFKVYTRIYVSQGGAYHVPLELGHGLVIHGQKVGYVSERPFLRPAADESKQECAAIMTKWMDKALKNAGEKS